MHTPTIAQVYSSRKGCCTRKMRKIKTTMGDCKRNLTVRNGLSQRKNIDAKGRIN